MTLLIELPDEIEKRLLEEAARQGQDAADYVSELVKHQLALRELELLRDRKPPQSLADLKPRIPTLPGTTWLESIRGEWPGEESGGEVERLLQEMS